MQLIDLPNLNPRTYRPPPGLLFSVSLSGFHLHRHPASRDATHRVLRGARVLLAEDEALVAMDIEHLLKHFGAEVLGPAGTLAEAAELAGREGQIDAAILDIDLHGQDVHPVAERLIIRGVPVVFYSGHANAQDIISLFPDAVFCAKPFLTEDLVDRVAHLLRVRRGS